MEDAIIAGLDDFWASAPWVFKENSTTVSTTNGQETIDLPDDFAGLLSVRERETDDGRKLIKLSKSEYDRLVPYSADISNNTPAYYKLYYNSDDGVWKLALYPTPDAAIDLYINYHVIEVGGQVPEKYTAPLVAAVGKYIYMPGSEQRSATMNEFVAEVERIKREDDPDVEEPGKFLDAHEALQAREKKWYEEG